jgi:co-chaperonin GroES (HSP10)
MRSSDKKLKPEDVKPLGPWVLVKIDERPEETAGGIVLPGTKTMVENVQEKTGRVMALGPGMPNTKNSSRHIPKGLEVGCKVLYRGFLDAAQHAKNIFGMEFEDGGEYCLMHMKDLLCVVGEDVKVGEFH